MLALKEKYNTDITVVHINHGLRPEALDETLVVKNLCDKYGLTFILKEYDVETLAKENKKPEEIDGTAIENHLRFKVSPDFVIKTGRSHLTDFLLWQSVYSELFFTDINWNKFRRVDFLRALRDFQSRKRRFGK